MKNFITRNGRETFDIGFNLARTLSGGSVVALSGKIGAGKTTLIQGIAAYFGIDDISSPTFTIIHEYDSSPPIYHIDAYRIGDKVHDRDLLADYMSDEAITLIEWADNVSQILPPGAITIEIEYIDETTRRISTSNNM